MKPSHEWFTEQAPELGSAFSLKITEKLHEEQTPYQRLEIYATQSFGRLMVLDGFIMLSGLDNFIYHEMLAHPALFSHPAPENVVIIGGGDCGTLQETLKHSCVKQVFQIEIDEQVTRAAEKYFPELCKSNNDPRAQFAFEDGIAWIKNAEPGSIDLIIVDSTDPIGPAKGLFQEPFYRACYQALGNRGLLVQQSESPLAHMNTIIAPMHKTMRAADFSDTQTLFFPLPVYPSGWWSATIASKDDKLTFTRGKDAVNTPLTTQYYSADIHKAALIQPPFVKKALANT